MSNMPSVDQRRFAQVPSAEIPRSSFDRSHGYKTTFNADDLVPIFVDEVLPGDTFNVKMQGFARMATPIHPVMDNLYMDTFFFYVPYRLVWDNFKRFMGEQTDPGDSTDYLVPTWLNPHGSGGWSENSLADYLGLPLGSTNIFSVNALPARAYYMIWNEWFRDQNLQDSDPLGLLKGDTSASLVDPGLKKRNKRHDYFTSALPWPQKGDAVALPLGTSAPVTGLTSTAARPFFSSSPGGVGGGLQASIVSSRTDLSIGATAATTGSTLYWGSQTGLQTDLSDATAATINELRQAFQIQKLLERDARGGTRYTEIVRSHFGVTSPDARLQRPEYLGGGSSPVNISPIHQTSETSAGTPLGQLAGIGTANLSGHGFTSSFTEHGCIIGLVNVRADLTYQQGLERFWARRTRYDFYWPALAHIGEQAVLNQEIYMPSAAEESTYPKEGVFGYQERYAEYRYKPSRITGLFRSSAAASLDPWHLSQEFGSGPLLNSSFITSNTPMDRVVAVPSEPDFIFDSFFQLRCARPMPVYGVPGLIDHF